jgi:hypothetical protein
MEAQTVDILPPVATISNSLYDRQKERSTNANDLSYLRRLTVVGSTRINAVELMQHAGSAK